MDVEKLDLERLCVVARMISHAHRANASLSMTKREVVGLIAQAVRDKLVAADALRGEMKTKVEAEICEAK